MKKLFSIACFLIGFVMLSSSAFSNTGDPIKPINFDKKALAVVIYEFTGSDPSNPDHWTLRISIPECPGRNQYCAFSYDNSKGVTKAQAVAAIVAFVNSTSGGLSALSDPFTVTIGTPPNETIITVYQRNP